MGFKMEYRDNKGRKHSSLDSMITAEMGTLVDEAARNIERVVRAQRCTVHGASPSISISKKQGGFSYSLSGCCERLVEKTEDAIKPFLS